MTTTDTNHVRHPLLSATAVRSRCKDILAYVEADTTGAAHFELDRSRLDETTDFVVETIRENYPDLDVPFHSRWRHFVFHGDDRWGSLASAMNVSREDRARIRFDLVVTSVLLDAGAGARWRYKDRRTGEQFARSEGLALASLDAFEDGLFSSDPDKPCQADACGLQAVTRDKLAAAFQVTDDNPLEGLDGRVTVMKKLGNVLAKVAAGRDGGRTRIGALFDTVEAQYGTTISASELLECVLGTFSRIWPGRIEHGGVNLGDTWRHPAAHASNDTAGLVPFHKLSQWLTYSLIEPLEEAGISVTEIDGLTGLAEYRNGGLFVDFGVLQPRETAKFTILYQPGDEVIVEWRALTVALLDEIAIRVREKLGMSDRDMPLASILEGGTWAAGRRIAARLREDGGPPLRIASDGSVF